MMRRAAILTRVSTPRQAEEDKISLGEQELRCRQYCENKGYIVVTVYSDVASGATKRRSGFQMMLRDAQAEKFDVVVAWKADRLARGISPCAALYEALENTGIEIETVAEPFDRTTFEVRAVLGRIELENIAQRTQMGREGRIKEGKHHIRPPLAGITTLLAKDGLTTRLRQGAYARFLTRISPVFHSMRLLGG